MGRILSIARKSAAYAAGIFALWVTAGVPAYAEGSYELQRASATSDTIYLEGDPTGVNLDQPRVTFLRVDILDPANEVIDLFGLDLNATTDVQLWCPGKIALPAPDAPLGTLPTPDFTGNFAGAAAGALTSFADVVSVQTLPRTITPITYTPPTVPVGTCGTKGVYTVLYSSAGRDGAGTNFFDTGVRNKTTSTLIRGRVWSDKYAMSMNGAGKHIGSVFYVVAGDAVGDRYRGVLWTLDLNNIDPFGFQLFANKVGIGPAANNYHSVNTAGTPAPTMDPLYPIYFNPPTKAVDPPASNINITSTTEQCVPGGSNVIVRFDSDGVYQYTIRVDGSDAGTTIDTGEVIGTGTTVVGTNQFVWNGILPGGGTIVAGTTYPIEISITAGEVHFPFFDVETADGSGTPAAGPVLITPTTLANVAPANLYFWNDTGTTATSTPVADTTTAGNASPHGFLGNEVLIDTWKYARFDKVTGSYTHTAACTPVNRIGLAKAASALVNNGNGSYTTTLTFVVSNFGNTALSAVQVTDNLAATFPTPVTFTAGAVAVGGGAGLTANGAFNGTTNQNLLAAGSTLAIGATRTITVPVTFFPNGSTASFTNTATASGTNGTTVTDVSTNGSDPDPDHDGNPGGAGENVPTPIPGPTPSISVTKTATPSTFTVGQPASYAITVTNAVGALATTANIVISDDLPSGITLTSAAGTNWSCTGTTSLSCTFTGTLAPGASTVLTLNVNVAASATAGTNFATGSGGGDTSCPADPRCVGTTPFVPVQQTADLSIVKTNGVNSVPLGGSTVYSLTVTNNGPSTVTGAVLTDAVATGLTKTAVACNATPGQCTVGTTPSIAQLEAGYSLPALASGQTYVLNVTATVTAASGSVSNVATIATPPSVTDPTPGNNSSTDTDAVASADFAITKTDGVASVAAGGNTTYTVTVTNNGPFTVTGAILKDAVATGLTKTAVACAATPGQCVTPPTIAQLESAGGFALPTLASGQTFVITVSANVTATTGNVANIATIAVPAGVTDPTAGNNSATDTDAVLSADLAVTKTDGVTSVAAGGSVTYTVLVTNNGPSAVNGAIIKDPAAAGLTKTAVACLAPVGQCTAGTTPTIAQLESAGGYALPNLNNGQTYRLSITATATGATTSISNVVTIAPPAGVGDLTPGNNSATDTDTVLSADLSITKSNGVSGVSTGASTTYTIVVTNNGPSAVTGAVIKDPAATGLTKTAVACAATPGQCTAGTTPTIAQLQSAGGYALPALASGQSYAITVTATVTAISGTVSNVATIAPPTGTTDPDTTNNSATDTDTVATADLAITKTNGVSSVNSGGSTTYTVTVTNNGPSAVTGAIIKDPAATGLTKTAVACAATPGQCTAGTTPTIVQLESALGYALPTLASGQSYSLSITATVTATSGSVSNVATIAAPIGITDPDTTNNSATDTDTLVSADLAILKTNGVSAVASGSNTSYTITVTNNGPASVTGAIIKDPAATGLTKTAVVCAATPGQCTAGTTPTIVQLESGAGYALPALASGQTYSISVTATVTATTGSVSNVATIAPPTGTIDPTPGNDSSTDTDTVTAADLAITKTNGVTSLSSGGSTTYTIVVTNNGPSSVTGAIIKDPAATGLTKTAVVCAATPGQCTAGTTPTIVQLESGAGYALPVLASGQSYALSVTANVTATSGSVSNVATIDPPAGTPDPTPGNNSATDTDTIVTADLAVVKTDGTATVSSGASTTYTILVTNNGPATVTGAILKDPAATGLNKTAVVCSATPGQCTAGATPTIAQLESGGGYALPALTAGQTYRIDVTATVTATSGSVSNIATIAPPTGVSDPTPGNDSSTDTDTVVTADLAIVKTNGATSVTSGANTTYTITVTNNGPQAVTGAIIKDPAATGLTKTAVVCAATPGQCTAGTTPTIVQLESGAGYALPALGSGQSYSISVTATVTATSGSVSNVATVTPPAGTSDPDPTNNTGTDTDTVVAADLAITKSNGVTSVNSGGSTTYTVTVTNNGPSSVTGAIIKDPAATGLTKTAVVCAATPGQCTAGTTPTIVQLESGAGYALPTLASGQSYSIDVTATVTATTGSVSNVATITNPAGVPDPTPGNNSATDTDTVVAADLAITKTNGVTSVNSGGSTTYTIVVTNNGPSSVTGAIIKDPAATGLTKMAVVCAATPGACTAGTTPTIVQLESGAGYALPALASGQTYAISVTANVTATSGSVSNVATIATPAGIADPDPSNNSATDTDTIVTADLAIVKTNSATSVTSGASTTYTITVTNNGPAAVTGAVIKDPAATGLTKTAVACAATPGQCTAGTTPTIVQLESGTGYALPALASGQTYAISVTANVTATTGSVSNVATIAPPTGTIDPTPGNDSSTDTDTVVAADLAITKTNGVTSVNAGASTTYTVTVTNNGPSSVTGAIIKDPAATGLTKTAVVCAATPGQCTGGTTPTIVQLESGAGYALPTLASGQSYSISVTATVTATTGSVSNIATITNPAGVPDPTPGNNTATDTDTVNAADLSITKTNGVTSLSSGGSTTYTVVVTNNGPSSVTGAIIKDPAATGLTKTAVVCAATPGACTAGTTPTIVQLESGAGYALPALASGQSYALSITANVTATSGSVSNVATIDPPAGTPDPTPGNNSATDTDTILAADLAITKTNGVTSVSSGASTSYTIVVTNNGPGSATGAIIKDPAATGLSKTAVACAATPGQCTAGTTPSIAQLESGAGYALPALASGQTYAITVSANVTATSGTVSNVATIDPPTGVSDPTPGNNSATDTDTVVTADLAITKTNGVTSVSSGGSTTYTIVVTNNGPQSVTGAIIKDPAATGLTKTAVVCAATPGQCTAGTTPTILQLESGAGYALPALASGQTYAISVSANVTATSGSVSNVATVTPPAGTSDPDTTNNTATDTDTLITADLAVVKTDGTANVSSGASTTYAIVVTNNGPATVTGAILKDPAATGLSKTAVVCSATPGQCTAGTTPTIAQLESGAGYALPALASGQSYRIDVTATVTATSGSVANTATIAPPIGTIDPTPGNDSSTDTDTVVTADLAITKTNGASSVNSGASTTYTVTVINNGPQSVTGAIIKDPAATGLTKTAVACAATPGQCTAGTTPTIVQLESGAGYALPALASGQSYSISVTATVTATSGSVANTATVAPPAGTSDPDPTNNTATDTDTVVAADLAISKTNGVTSLSSGASTTYTVVVTNNGPASVTGAIIKDPAATGLSKTAVTCAATPGQCTAGTTPTIVQLESGAGYALPALASGQSYAISVTATVTATSGSVSNVATIDPPTGIVDPTPGNNSATDTDTILAADLAIVKTDGSATATSGASTTYTIVVTNNGPGAVSGAILKDPAATGLSKTAVVCSATPGQCTAGTTPTIAVLESGAGYALPALASGQSYSIDVTATVTATTGTVSNVATIATPTGVTDPTPGNNSSTDTDTVVAADLSISKTNGATSVNSGGSTTYTVVVTNNGPSSVTGAILKDAAATGLTKTAVACAATPGQCTAGTTPTIVQLESGAGYALPAIASGQTYAIAITANVTATSGSVTNTATVATPAGTPDPTPGNNSASDTDSIVTADLAITKTNGVTSVSSGASTTYTVVVTNNGPDTVTGAVIKDPAATGLSKAAVACAATPGACTAGTTPTIVQLESGAGYALPALASGQSYALSVTVNVTATSGSVSNVATIATPTGVIDPTPGNNSATDTDTVLTADLAITKSNGATTVNSGGNTTYTIVVTNNGPQAVTGAIIKDPAATGLTKTAVACAATPGACTAGTTPTIVQLESGAGYALPALASGQSYAIAVTANVTATSGSVSNVATISPPTGTSDPDTTNNSATDTDTIVTADLAIVKSNGVSTVSSGAATTYTITVTNNGPSSVTGAVIKDPAATGLTKTAVACAATPGQCTAGTTPTIVQLESGAGYALPALASGQTYVLSVTANVTATSGSVANTATIAPPTGTIDPTPGNDSSTDTDTVLTADLAITKSNGATTVNSGGTTTYTIVVTNNGPQAVTGAVIKDPAATGIAKTAVVCAATPGQCTAGTTPTIVQLESAGGYALPALASGQTYAIAVTVNVTATSGTVSNVATIAPPTGTSDPTPGNNSATDTDTIVTADLAIAKTNGATSVNSGGTTTYTVTVTNNGPSTVTGAVIKDPAATGLTKTTVVCAATPGQCTAGTTPTIVQLESGAGYALPALASGQTYALSITANVTATSGSVSNTATIDPPTGVIDPTPGNNSATDTDTIVTADLAIAKTNGATTVNSGGTTTYTVTVTNNGPSTVTGAVIKDPAATGLTKTAVVCAATPGQCTAGTTPTIVQLESGAGYALPALTSGQTYVLSITANVTATSGSVSNVATIAAPTGTIDPDTTNNTATDTDTIVTADLAITKTNGASSVTSGGSTTYTIVVTNNGPSSVTGAIIKDAAATGLSKTAVACAATPGQCTAGTTPTIGQLESGAGYALPALASGQTYAIAVSANVTATSGNVSNTATIAAPTGTIDPTPGNNSATDTDSVPSADLSISKTDGASTYTPGVNAVYTIVVTNNGPSAVTGATVSDPLPSGITTANWTCVASGGSSCPASGTGAINTGAVNLAVNGTATFTLTLTVPSTFTGNLVNTATVTNPAGVPDNTPGNNSATDTDTPAPFADVAVKKTVNNRTPALGDVVTFTITATNNGPSTATGVQVTDGLPPGLDLVLATPSAGTSYTAATGLWNIGTIANGGVATLTIQATVTATDPIVNTATITAQNEPDPDPSNNTSGTGLNAGPVADIQVLKTVNNAAPNVGDTVTFTIAVKNAGPDNASNVKITDALPAGLNFVSATPSVGTFAANVWNIGNLATNASATLQVVATVTAAGPKTNTATKTSETELDPAPENDSSGVTLNGLSADIQVVKVVDDTSPLVTQTVMFTIRARNNGPDAATNVVVTDLLPAGLGFVSYAATQGTYTSATGVWNVGGLASTGSGNNAALTIMATVNAPGTIVNNATKTGGDQPDPNPSNDTDHATLGGVLIADLSVTKTDGATTAIAGNPISYTITVSNAGPSTATNASVADTLPTGLINATWTCAGTGGASCTPVSGTGNIGGNVTIPSGSSVIYTLNATVSPSATGSLANTATVTAPTGTTDPTPGNNSATDTDTIASQADLSITKTDGSATYTPGGTISYTITASNAGPSNANGPTVSDTLPGAITGATWTCAGAGGGTCTASGSGNINATVNLPVGGSVTYTVTGTVAVGTTGSLANTATVTAPPGVTDPTPGNNSATDTDTALPRTDLAITKTDGSTTYTPGAAISYTIVATNNGPSIANTATVADTVPGAITGVTWTCVASAGSSCTASGSGNINDTAVLLVVGGTATYTVSGTVAANASGTLTNTATVTAAAGAVDPTPGNNSATDSDTAALSADLSIIKTDGSPTYTPGSALTYTIVASNGGPSNVASATVTDNFPAAFTGTWTCVGAGGGTCAASGSGNINTTVALPAGSSVTFTVTGTVSAAATGSLINTAAITSAVPDPNTTNNQSTDTDTPNAQADLSITKTDGSATYTPGNTVTYTIVASNAGPSNATGVTVADTLPASITGATWTCAGAGGGTCTASGSGNINATVNLPVGGSVTYTVIGTVNPATTGNLVNTATVTSPAGVTDPTPGDHSATDTDTLNAQADLSISKTDGVTTAIPGSTLTYTITASNGGPSTVVGATVADTFPASFTGATWTCAASAGSSCTASGSGNINATVTIAAGGNVVYTVTGTVSAAATGTLVNTATVAVPTGVTDPTPGNNSATDTDTLTPQANLGISKTDGSPSYTPGSAISYTIVVSNAGPSNAVGATVNDTIPAGILTPSWTCVGAGGGTCGASGNGNIADTVNVPVGGTVTYTLSGTVDANYTGALSNTATVTAPAGTPDPVPGNNSATDTDNGNALSHLVVAKTDGSSTYTPGGTATYTITVTNTGPSTAANVSVSDPLPAGVTLAGSPTCVATGIGSLCGTITGAANDPSFSVSGASVDAAAGASLIYSVPVKFASSLTGTVLNTATATAPSSPDASGSDSDTAAVSTHLTVAKTDGSGSYVPGGSAIYVVTIGNTGPSDASSVTVGDTLPGGVTLSAPATCTASAGASCGLFSGGAIGGGSVSTSSALIPVGETLTLSIPVNFNPGMTTDPLVNTASANAPNNGGPASGSDSDVRAAADGLTISKTDGSATYTPGGSATYTVTVSNAGPSTSTGVNVTDSLPAGVTLSAAATCATTGTASCGTVTGPTGGVSFGVTGAQIAPGGSLVFTLPVNFDAGLTVNPLVNTASVSDALDPTPISATDSDALDGVTQLTVDKDDANLTYTPGGTALYVIRVSNLGPSDAHAVNVVDTLPAGVTLSAAPSCSTVGTASCATANGAVGGSSVTLNGGSIAAGAGNALLISVPVNYNAALTTDPLINSASASDPDDADGASGSDSDVLKATTGLTVTKDDGSATYTPGGIATYTIRVTNAGPSNANNLTVTDALPPGVSLASGVTCAVTGTGTCGSITGATGGTLFSASGATLAGGAANALVYTVNVNFASGMQDNPLANSVQVSDPSDPVVHTGTDSDTRDPDVALAVAKSDGSPTYVPGGTATYTVTVINTGLSDANNVSVTDTLPGGVSVNGTPSCVANGAGANCGTVSAAGGTVTLGGGKIPAGAGRSLILSIPVSFAPDLSINPLQNTATATDPEGTGGTDTDSDTPAPAANTRIEKSVNPGVVGGGPITYTLLISNAGPSSANGATYNDPMPAGITAVTASCGLPTGGAACGPAPTITGTGSITVSGVVATLPPGGTVTVTINGTAPAGPTQSLVNTATVTNPPGTPDPDTDDNTSTSTVSTPVSLQSFEVE